MKRTVRGYLSSPPFHLPPPVLKSSNESLGCSPVCQTLQQSVFFLCVYVLSFGSAYCQNVSSFGNLLTFVCVCVCVCLVFNVLQRCPIFWQYILSRCLIFWQSVNVYVCVFLMYCKDVPSFGSTYCQDAFGNLLTFVCVCV